MKKLILCLVLSQAGVANAAPTFTNISATDFDEISQDMAANFTHNSMLGASKMGTIFGFQVGTTGAVTASPRTNEIVKRNAGAELPNIYNAGIVAAVGIPFGIAFEGVFFPETEFSGAKLSATSLGLKYNINDVIPVLPVNLALRGLYSVSKFIFEQTVNSVTSSVENNNSVTGLQLLFSPMIPIVEPYVGIGYLSSSNKLSVTGSTSIFDSNFSSGQSESRSMTSTQFLAGVDLNLLALKLGAEYSQAFGTSRIGFKLAFGF